MTKQFRGVKSGSVLGRFLTKCYKQMNKKYDIFVVITGGEGVGKSRGLFLNIADYWFRRLKGEAINKEALNISVDKFVKCLRDSGPLSFVGLDEAGDSMDTQNWANKFNKVLYQAYTIIREKFLFSVVVLPSFFDLNPRFRKRRVRFLIDVTRRVDNRCNNCVDINTRGKKVPHQFVGEKCDRCGGDDFEPGFVMYDIYDRNKIREILERNAYKKIKKVRCGITPLASGRVREYRGVMKDYYSGLKKEKMHQILNKLYDETMEFSDVPQKPKCVHHFRYNKTKDIWWCDKCGYETGENPFRIPEVCDKSSDNNKKTTLSELKTASGENDN